MVSPHPENRFSALGSYCGSDFVKGGVTYIKCFHMERSIHKFCEDLGYFLVSLAVVGFRTLCAVPQAYSERFGSGWGNKGDLVLKSLLFSKYWDDFLFQRLRELDSTVGLQMQIDSACKHVGLLEIRGKG